jgi:hypothetical protein
MSSDSMPSASWMILAARLPSSQSIASARWATLMEINYRQVAIALGVTLFLAAFRYVFSTVPKVIAIAGMVVGILIVAATVFWTQPSPLAGERLPGFSSTFGLKIKDAAKLSQQYLFEYQTPEGAKAAFYFPAAGDRFVFPLTDTHNDVQSIDLPVGPGGIRIAFHRHHIESRLQVDCRFSPAPTGNALGAPAACGKRPLQPRARGEPQRLPCMWQTCRRILPTSPPFADSDPPRARNRLPPDTIARRTRSSATCRVQV